MENLEDKWALGEAVTLPREMRLLKKSNTTTYERLIGARYICIRKATARQRGILMKVLDKTYADQIIMVKGEPFCKDNRDERIADVHYSSYSFPTAKQVKEALGILRGNQSLLKKFEEASMHINPDSTFWVKNTTHNILFMKSPQYLDGRDGMLYPSKGNNDHCRITFVYFYKGNLNW